MYGAGFLFGAAAGSFVPVFIPPSRSSISRRSARTLISSVLAAGAVASLVSSFVHGGIQFFHDLDYAVVTGIFFVSTLIGSLLPRLVGGPLIVVGGAVLVLFGWSVLVYPRSDEGLLLGRLRRTSEEARVWFGSSIDPEFSAPLPITDQVQLRVLRIDFHKLYPLIGDSSRIALIEVRSGVFPGIFGPPQSLFDFLGHGRQPRLPTLPGISSALLTFDFPAAALDYGVRKDIRWAENGVSLFSPPRIK
jgi:hypothetical protein